MIIEKKSKIMIGFVILIAAICAILTLIVLRTSNINEEFQKFGKAEAKAVYVDEKVVTQTYPTVLTLLPLRATMIALDYDIKWDGAKYVVEAIKDSKYTKITISQNDYFINGVGSIKLSNAPFVKNDRTQVPVEFFYEVFGIKIESKDNGVYFSSKGSFEMEKISGYVTSIKKSPFGALYEISSPNDLDNAIPFYANLDTIFQKKVKINSYVTVLGKIVDTNKLLATVVY